MVASDQVGIGRVNANTFLASKTKEDKKEKGLNLGIFNMLNREKKEASEFEKIKNEAFGNTSSNVGQTDTKVASSDSAGSGGGYIDAGSRGFVSPEQATKMLTYPERFNMTPGELRYLRGSIPIKKVDASDNKIYSDSTQTLGATEGSLLAMADTGVQRGIVTAAPETKVSETRMAGEGFFSPKNFQKSGVPDATIMTGEQVRQSLTGDPGYSRFGSLDRPGTQAAKDTAAFNERVKTNFFSPIKADARSIAERRESNVQSMRDEARIRDAQFKETGKQTFGGRVGERVSGDDTYGTNVMSNPAFGFRSKMSVENQKKYDASAAEATRRSEVEPSKGNLIQSTVNIGKRIFNTAIGANEGTAFTKEVKLEKRGEAEQRRYEKYLNRPTYQKEATARKEAGITNQMTIDKNKEQVRVDAAARNEAFQAEKRAKAFEKADARNKATGRDQANTGTGRDGTFGEGTYGKGMPSNPDFRGAGNNKAYTPAQTDAPRQTVASLPSDYKQTEAKAFAAAAAYQQAKNNPNVKAGVDNKGQVSIKAADNSAKARAQAAALSRKASGKSIGQTKAANKASMKQKAADRHSAFKKTGKSTVSARRAAAKKSMQARAKKRHAAFKKRRKNKKKKCDIRCKYDIMPLTNMNLIMDDLAEVAYFVKEIQK